MFITVYTLESESEPELEPPKLRSPEPEPPKTGGSATLELRSIVGFEHRANSIVSVVLREEQHSLDFRILMYSFLS